MTSILQWHDVSADPPPRHQRWAEDPWCALAAGLLGLLLGFFVGMSIQKQTLLLQAQLQVAALQAEQ